MPFKWLLIRFPPRSPQRSSAVKCNCNVNGLLSAVHKTLLQKNVIASFPQKQHHKMFFKWLLIGFPLRSPQRSSAVKYNCNVKSLLSAEQKTLLQNNIIASVPHK